MFVITDEWLKTWRTPAGGYTRRQLQTIGIPWPPPKGWKRTLKEKIISDDAVEKFQKGARL